MQNARVGGKREGVLIFTRLLLANSNASTPKRLSILSVYSRFAFRGMLGEVTFVNKFVAARAVLCAAIAKPVIAFLLVEILLQGFGLLLLSE